MIGKLWHEDRVVGLGPVLEQILERLTDHLFYAGPAVLPQPVDFSQV